MFAKSYNHFTFYDGETGKTDFVNLAIIDGKRDIVIDQDELDLIRLNGEGGLDPEELRRKQDWDAAVTAHKQVKKIKTRKKRKEKRKRDKANEFNYKAFGIKV